MGENLFLLSGRLENFLEIPGKAGPDTEAYGSAPGASYEWNSRGFHCDKVSVPYLGT